MYFVRMENKRKKLSEMQRTKKSEKNQDSDTQSQALAFEEWKKRKDEQIKLQKSIKNQKKRFMRSHGDQLGLSNMIIPSHHMLFQIKN